MLSNFQLYYNHTKRLFKEIYLYIMKLHEIHFYQKLIMEL